MIRLRATSSIQNNNAFWYNATSSYTTSSVALSLTSSYSGEKFQPIFATVSSAKRQPFGSWILFNVSGSLIPTASGQYEVNIYDVEESDPLIWGTYDVKFGDSQERWGSAIDEQAGSILLANDRVFISGSDYDNITRYKYQDQPVYKVYNG